MGEILCAETQLTNSCRSLWLFYRKRIEKECDHKMEERALLCVLKQGLLFRNMEDAEILEVLETM